jgi:hypothetical protein
MALIPRVIQRPSPNYTPTLIQHNLLFAHMMEGSYAGSVAWLCRTNSKASAHLCMSEDGLEVSQLVPLQFKAWAQCAFNSMGVSLEIPGFTAQGIPTERWQAAATIFGWLSVAYSIPPMWAQKGLGRGVCQHHDLGAAGGGHVDCTSIGSVVWQDFIRMVQNAHDHFAQAPLPLFALHGLPNPQQVEAPPDVADTPSHNGAARIEPNEVIAPHMTTSGFPDGSVADLQWRLNKAGAAPPLQVDGYMGARTQNAVVAFQGAHNLFIDGKVGPMTWRALRAITGVGPMMLCNLFMLAVAALLAFAPAQALAQQAFPQVTSINNDDLFQIITHGAASGQNSYVRADVLSTYVADPSSSLYARKGNNSDILTLLYPTAYPTIIPAYSGTFTLTSGTNTFTVDATTAANVQAALTAQGIVSVISTAGFPTGSFIAPGGVSGTTITVSNYQTSPNALVSGATAVQFGINRFASPYVGATSLMAKEGFFGDASQGNSTWNTPYFQTDFPNQAAVLGLKSGVPGGFFGSHTSTLTSSSNSSVWGLGINVVNDNPTYTNTVWGIYMQFEQAPGAAQYNMFGMELSPVNMLASPTTPNDPYRDNSIKQIEDIRLDTGNGLASLTGGITDFIHLISNGGQTALHGIDVSVNALNFTADSNPPALAMPKNAALTWYTAAGQKAWSIYDNTGTSASNTLVLTQQSANFSAPVQTPGGSASLPGLVIGPTLSTGIFNAGAAVEFAVAGNQVAYFNATNFQLSTGFIQAGASVNSCAGGTLAPSSWKFSLLIITTLPASGNCAVSLPTSPVGGQEVTVVDAVGTAGTHNIVITPNAGNIDASSTYTINGNFGSWSGFWTGSLFKTTAHQ